MTPPSCPNCDTPMEGAFCPACGQKAIHSDDLTLGHALHHLVHETLHLDGRLWTSLKLLFLRPGQLSLDFAEGRRARHLHPVRLLLVAIGLYFFVANPTVMNLEHIAKRDRSGQVAARLNALAQREGVTAARISEARSARLQVRFKLAQMAWIGVTGGLLALLFRKRFRQIGQHLAVAGHNATWGFFIYLPVGLLMAVTPNPMAPPLGAAAAGAVYSFLAYRRVYGEGGLSTLLKAALLTLLDLAFTFTVMGYAVFAALR